MTTPLTIDPSALSLIENERIHPSVFKILHQMKPARQIECAEFMLSANNFTKTFAAVMLAASASDALVSGEKSYKPLDVTRAQLRQIEADLALVKHRYHAAAAKHGEVALTLLVTTKYLKAILANEPIRAYLTKQSPHSLRLFEKAIKIEMHADWLMSVSNQVTRYTRPKTSAQNASASPIP